MASLDRLGPLSNLVALEELELVGPLPDRAPLRLVCAAMFPALRSLNGSSIGERERRASAALRPVLPRMGMREWESGLGGKSGAGARCESPEPADLPGPKGSEDAQEPLVDMEAAEQWVTSLERELTLFRCG